MLKLCYLLISWSYRSLADEQRRNITFNNINEIAEELLNDTLTEKSMSFLIPQRHTALHIVNRFFDIGHRLKISFICSKKRLDKLVNMTELLKEQSIESSVRLEKINSKNDYYLLLDQPVNVSILVSVIEILFKEIFLLEDNVNLKGFFMESTWKAEVTKDSDPLYLE